jgi:glycerol-3-phosphate dehydrogenase
VSAYFAKPVTRGDIVWSYAGVRPLFDDGASTSKEATRDYVLKLNGEPDAAPLLSIFGGKLTTYRRLSEKAVDLIAGAIGPRGKRWTEGGTLPGGDFPARGFDALVKQLQESYPRLQYGLLRRLARSYGTRARVLLGEAQTPEDLGTHFGAGLHRREVDYLMDHEWALTADDVLWRRSKLGLRVTGEDGERLAAYMTQRIEGK